MKKYIHLEKFGHPEVAGIELGTTYVFPKLDGTNGSVWLEGDFIKTGSRNKELTLDDDNAGFCNYIININSEPFKKYLTDYPNHILYGEWLVPHTLKTYLDNAWKKFYVFDVYNTETNKFLPYDTYVNNLILYGIDYIPYLDIVENGDYNKFLQIAQTNKFLIKNKCGIGEGIVIKNYNFCNKYNRTVWAKIVVNTFKEKHQNTKIINNEPIEQQITDLFITKEFVEKEYNKLALQGWSKEHIPRLLNTIFYELIREESWEIIKKFKYPIINFKKLQQCVFNQIKTLKPELF